MAVKEGYDVLRLIEHGQVCYISSEFVAGKPLAVWLKYHPRLPKEQLLGWILCMARQLEMLNAVMAEEYAKGNYVIVGGDFNHELAHSFGNFPSEQKQPTWAYELTDDDVADGFRVVASGDGVGTCRAAEIPYTEGVNYQTVLDGFVVSDNVEVTKVRNIDTGYEFSDHNPVEMTFVLK